MGDVKTSRYRPEDFDKMKRFIEPDNLNDRLAARKEKGKLGSGKTVAKYVIDIIDVKLRRIEHFVKSPDHAWINNKKIGDRLVKEINLVRSDLKNIPLEEKVTLSFINAEQSINNILNACAQMRELGERKVVDKVETAAKELAKELPELKIAAKKTRVEKREMREKDRTEEIAKLRGEALRTRGEALRKGIREEMLKLRREKGALVGSQQSAREQKPEPVKQKWTSGTKRTKVGAAPEIQEVKEFGPLSEEEQKKENVGIQVRALITQAHNQPYPEGVFKKWQTPKYDFLTTSLGQAYFHESYDNEVLRDLEKRTYDYKNMSKEDIQNDVTKLETLLTKAFKQSINSNWIQGVEETGKGETQDIFLSVNLKTRTATPRFLKVNLSNIKKELDKVKSEKPLSEREILTSNIGLLNTELNPEQQRIVLAKRITNVIDHARNMDWPAGTFKEGVTPQLTFLTASLDQSYGLFADDNDDLNSIHKRASAGYEKASKKQIQNDIKDLERLITKGLTQRVKRSVSATDPKRNRITVKVNLEKNAIRNNEQEKSLNDIDLELAEIRKSADYI